MNGKLTTTTLAALTAAATLTAGLSAKAGTLIDYTFDSNAGNDIGPAVQKIDNGQGGSGTADTGTGAVQTTAQVTPTSNVGFNSSGLVDLSGYTSFTATFEIDSITLSDTVANLEFNGLFFGVVAGPSATDADATGNGGGNLWVNTPVSLGYLPGSTTWGDHLVVYNDGSSTAGAGVDADTVIASLAPTNASLADGFTVSITVSDDGTWSIASSGLNTELNDSGTLATDFGASWSDFAFVGLNTTLQGDSSGQLDVGRMTLTAIPEPGSLALLAAGGLCVLRRRRG